MSLPILLVQMKTESPYVETVLKTFNGFGYIGNTIFALPSIKGLIPNGFNTDGSLNSTEFTTTSVLTYSYIDANSGVLIGINANSLASDKYVYNKDENYNRNPQGVIAPRAMFAKVSTDSTGRITSLTPNTAFHVTDYNEFAREVGRCAKVDESNIFTANNPINLKRALSSSGDTVITTTDSNNKGLTSLISYYTNGLLTHRLLARNNTTGKTAYIDIVSGDDGKLYLSMSQELANSLLTSDNSSKIPSTSWVNNKFQKVSTLPAQPDPNVTYLIPEE